MSRLEHGREGPKQRQRRAPLLSLAVIVATTLTAGCADPGPGPADPPEGAAPRPSLEPVGRIGCSDCADERQITPVALAILEDERVAVLDAFEPFVRVFTGGGTPQLTFGNKGQGPGELGMELPGTGYLPGIWLFGNELGGVTVIDIFPFSLEAFDARGGFVEHTGTGLPDAVPTAQAFDAEARMYYRLSFSVGPRSDESRRISRCRFATVGDASCRRFADPVPFLQPEGMPGSALGSLVLAAAPGGSLVVANVNTYDLWVLDDRGEVVRRFGRDLPLPEKSEAEIASERQRLERMGRPEREVALHRPHIASYGLQVDGNGRIWVLTGRHDDDNSVFDVFASDGTYLDEVVIDATVRRTSTLITPFVTGGDLLVAAARRADGNDEIRVYRIAAETR